jgi:hypothetical protein
VPRRLSLIVALASAGALIAASSASAATVSTDCAGFPGTLAAATPNETIVLTGLCTGQTNTIPAAATNLTIEGASTGTNGFNGLGTTTSPALNTTGSPNGLTLRNLIFENYAANAVRISTTVAGNPYVIDGVTFANNHTTTISPSATGAGGLFINVFAFSACPATGPSITISDSTFSGNSGPGASGGAIGTGGGGGAFVGLVCNNGGGTPTVNVANSTFSGNAVNAPASTAREGGGLWIAAAGSTATHPLALNQSGNLFTGNSVSGSGSSYAGAGEFTAGAFIDSTGDRFIGNSLSSPTTSTTHSEGAGLSTRSGGDALSPCTGPGGATSIARNLVAAGNTIGAPTGMAEAGEGAGIYAGCSIGTGGYNLTLINSTISGNQAPGGGVGGVDGEATDVLILQNTIVEGNTGAGFGGFGASPGANVNAANSDVCAPGGGSPFPGSGNICADPALVNPAAGDVKETSSSPTLDAGSNGFVTTATDVFGGDRIRVSKPGDAAIVDIGAAEFKLPSNEFSIVGVQGRTLIVNVDSPGKVVVTQTGASSSRAVEAKKKKKRKKKSNLLLHPSSASGGPGQVVIPLLLTKRANQKLKQKGKVSIAATVTFTPTGGEPKSKGTTLQIKGKKKKKKKK